MSIDTLQRDVPEDDMQVESDVPALDRVLSLASRHIALLAAWIAMCGSLFMSEVLGWQPCVLCWYQRILMYPLALILAIGIVRRDRAIHYYVLPFSLIGACISLYHYLLIKTDWFPPPPCTVGIPCTVDYLDWFGFINIPFLALVAFLIITLMMSAWALILPAPETDTRAAPSARFDSARLAVGMIVVAVVVAFMLASTFV
jgi:disulfide bond formation protein DsbB